MAEIERPARAARRQPAPGHERVPARRPEERAEAARAEGAVPRSRARVRRHAPRAARRARRCESIETSSLHLDLITDLQAHQLAHLLDRLPDPRAGRRARAHAPQGTDRDAGRRRSPRPRANAAGRRTGRARAARPHDRRADSAQAGNSAPIGRQRRGASRKHGVPDHLRHLHPLRPQGRPRLRRRAGDAARARAADRGARRGRAAPRRRSSPPRCCTTSATC